MDIILLSLLTFIAATIGTITGFGSSTIMVPFVLLFFPLPTTLLFVGIIHTFNDLWKIILFNNAIKWKILLSFGIPGIIFSVLGANLITTLPETLLLKIFGLILMLYVVLLIQNPKLKLPHSPLAAGLGGTLSGLMAGVFGVGGVTRSLFLSAFNFKKEVYIFTSGSIALFIDLPRLLTYYQNGTRLNSDLAWGMLIFIPVSFVAAEFAKKIVHKIPQAKFRLVIAAALFIIAFHYLYI